MGERGPIPKRDDKRAGHRAKSELADKVVMRAKTRKPAADERWCEEAADWYDSLAKSGQARYFEPSDWQYARVVAAMLSRLLTSSSPNPQMFKAVSEGMDKLGVTEASRRRMRIEVDRGKTKEGDAVIGDAARDKVEQKYRALLEGNG